MALTKAIVGIIGGSGVYDLPGLEDIHEGIGCGDAMGRALGPTSLQPDRSNKSRIPARHGRGHKLSPSGINYRANIDALKRAGVTDIVSVSACGSFKPELYPGLFVLADQFIDRTFARAKLVFRQWLRRPCLDGASCRALAA